MGLNWGRALSLAGLSLILAFFFWVIATEAKDPMVEKTYPAPLPVELRNLPADLVAYGEAEKFEVRVKLRAPESLWASLQASLGDIKAYVDLSQVEPGVNTLPVSVQISRRPSQVVSISPAEITLTVEPMTEIEVPVAIALQGQPALGFVSRSPSFTPQTVTAIGPRSFITQVKEALIEVSVEAARESISEAYQPLPVNEIGDPVPRVSLVPRAVNVALPVEQLGNIRDLAIHVVLAGAPAPGYRVGIVEKEPPSVAVSGRRDVVQGIPGYLNTEPIDLSGANQSITRTVKLQTPEGLSVLSAPQILVKINLELLESLLTLQLAPEIKGLRSTFTATVSPAEVQLLVRGPFDKIAQVDANQIGLQLDLTGLLAGEHTITPQPLLPDESLRVDSILPQSSFSVIIKELP